MPTYKKIIGVHHRMENGVMKRYGPGQPDGDIFVATEVEVKHFRDTLDMVDPEPADEKVENAPVKESVGKGKVDIKNKKTGKKINDVPLTDEEANEIAQDPDEQSDSTAVIKVIHKGGGYYDVIDDSTGKKLNRRSLRKDMADEFAEEKRKEKGLG